MTITNILQHLQDYSEKYQQGNDSLKSSVWQMTKLRRKQVRGMLTMEENVLSADQIREDIRPRVMVRNETTNDNRHEEEVEEEEEEPELISEGDKNDKNDDTASTVLPLRFSTMNTKPIPQWKVVDVVQALQARHAHNETPSSTTIDDLVPTSAPDSSSGGIRQRKNKTDKAPSGYSSSRTTGTVEMKADHGMDNADSEEEKLWHRDPLELFAGVRPSDLKFAQTQAKEALDSYIQAANLAALILGELQNVKRVE